MTPRELATQWRAAAAGFRDHEIPSLAAAYERCATELEVALQQQDEAALTLSEASRISGYSADHLGRLIREDKIPNAGRPGAPRIARGDVPVKPGAVAPRVEVAEVDRTQIVRSVIDEGVG